MGFSLVEIVSNCPSNLKMVLPSSKVTLWPSCRYWKSNWFSFPSFNSESEILSKTILPASMMILLAGLIYEKTQLQRILGSNFLVLLGNASFAFYLIHISYVNLKLKDWFLCEKPTGEFTFDGLGG